MEEKIQNEFVLTDGYAVVNDNYDIVTADESLYRFIGIGISNYNSLSDAIHPVDIDDFKNVCYELHKNETKTMVIRMHRCDNVYRWVLISVKRKVLFSSDEKKLYYYEMTFSDVLFLKQEHEYYKSLNKEINNTVDESVNTVYPISEINNKVSEMFNDKDNYPEFAIIMIDILNKDKLNKTVDSAEMDLIYQYMIKYSLNMVENRGIVFSDESKKIVILITGINKENSIRAFVSSFRSKILWECKCTKKYENIEFCIGISRYPENGNNILKLEKKLHKAFDISKNKTIGNYVIYKEHLHGEL